MIYITGQKLCFVFRIWDGQTLQIAKFVAKFKKSRNLTHTNVFTSMDRPTVDQRKFLQ